MKAAPSLVLLAAVVVVAGLLGYDAAQPSSATATPPLTQAGQAQSGSWYCAAGDTNEGRTTSVVFAPIPGEQPAPTDVVVSTFGSAGDEPGSETRVLPEDVRVDELPAGRDAIGVAARWWGRPAVLSRVWRVGGADFPSGWVAGPCEPEPSPNWFVPGMSTDGGGQARVVLANPFESDATASVTLVTPDGLLNPRRLENVLVPAGGVQLLVLNEHAPEQPDLGVIVEVLAGRLVAEGVQSFNAAIGGVDGVTLVKAAPEAAPRWTIPWLEVAERVGADEEGDQDGVDSWIWIANPSSETADVQLNLHTATGAQPPAARTQPGLEPPATPGEGTESPTAIPGPTPSPEPTPTDPVTDAPSDTLTFESLFIEPGTVRRIDMADLLPDGVGRAGVTVESTNEVPIAVSAGTIRRDPAAVLSALAIQIGAVRPDPTWVWSVPPPQDRSTHLHVVNLGEQEATLTIRHHTGEGRLTMLDRDVTVAAGGLVDVDLTDDVGDAEQLTVYVTADQPVVAGYRSLNLEGRPDLVIGIGASSAAWRGSGLIPTAAYRPDLVQQLGTAGQPMPPPIEFTDDFDFDIPEPSPTPAPAPSSPGFATESRSPDDPSS